jgi:hypothetical protein
MRRSKLRTGKFIAAYNVKYDMLGATNNAAGCNTRPKMRPAAAAAAIHDRIGIRSRKRYADAPNPK